MDNYQLYIRLLGLRDGNLPVFKDNRLKRYQSVRKIVDLVDTATHLAPKLPEEAFVLDPAHPEWDDRMAYPTVNWMKYVWGGLALTLNMAFYSYNHHIFTSNIRFRNFRTFFPLLNLAFFASTYFSYRRQMIKINLFDEYVWLRGQELAREKEFIFDHEDFRQHTWFWEDFKTTMERVHRQANNHDASDFADSQLLLQDFIRRYSDPQLQLPIVKELI